MVVVVFVFVAAVVVTLLVFFFFHFVGCHKPTYVRVVGLVLGTGVGASLDTLMFSFYSIIPSYEAQGRRLSRRVGSHQQTKHERSQDKYKTKRSINGSLVRIIPSLHTVARRGTRSGICVTLFRTRF